MNETNQQQSIEALQESELRQALEAVLFAAGYPLTYEKLAQTFGYEEERMKIFVEEFALAYNQAERGILLLTMEDRCQLCSKEEYKDYVRNAMGIKSSGKLSASCLEALAIIAYNQPVTKAYVEHVRGVDCSWALGTLCDKQLIEPKGRLDAPGKPILYGTTDDFLRVFGLRCIDELPKAPSTLAEKPEFPAQISVSEGSGQPPRPEDKT